MCFLKLSIVRLCHIHVGTINESHLHVFIEVTKRNPKDDMDDDASDKPFSVYI